MENHAQALPKKTIKIKIFKMDMILTIQESPAGVTKNKLIVIPIFPDSVFTHAFTHTEN